MVYKDYFSIVEYYKKGIDKFISRVYNNINSCN